MPCQHPEYPEQREDHHPVPRYALGIDPGIRGGAGLAAVDIDSGDLLFAMQVGRDPNLSTIQMMVAVRDAVRAAIADSAIKVVAREDHVFPGSMERIARNILRRLNGVIDVAVTDKGFIETETYFGFPVGTWKVLAGLPGDLGKERKSEEKGVRNVLGSRRKKGTQAQYLETINALLKHEHKTVDEADAHAIALAARSVWHVRTGVSFLDLLPARVAEAMWDKDKCGVTVRRAIKDGAAALRNRFELRKFLRDFGL